jgi:putative tryptophan/tyrosine transport system substrate-binding protein
MREISGQWSGVSKRIVFFVLVVIFLMHNVVVQAQPAKLARMGYLGNDQSPASMPREKAFLQGLRDHGWIEGQNILIERRYWDNRAQRLPVLADETVRLKREYHSDDQRDGSPSCKESYQ